MSNVATKHHLNDSTLPQPTKISDDQELLEMMLSDMANQTASYRPTSYWQQYSQRISAEIRREGLTNFQRNHGIIKGYSYIGHLPSDIFGADVKSKVLESLLHLPVLKSIKARYSYHLDRTNKLLAKANDQIDLLTYTLLMCDPIASGILGTVEDTCVGNPLVIDCNGKKYSRNMLRQICRVALYESFQSKNAVRSVIEIGGGYGSFCEIISKVKQLDYFVLVDIPPVSYVSTQYLKAIFPGRVVDYRDLRGKNKITLADVQNKITVIPNWMIEKLDLPFDMLWNTDSFQEMEKSVVEHYLQIVAPKVRSVFIDTLKLGHKANAGGQKSPISSTWLDQAISKHGFQQVKKSQSNPFLWKAHDALMGDYEISLHQRE